MSTTKDKEFDYQEYMRESEPNQLLQKGFEERKERREAAKTRITIRIDEEVLDEFKRMVPNGRGYQGLINIALREWLIAREVKELVRGELEELVSKAVSSIESVAHAAKG